MPKKTLTVTRTKTITTTRMLTATLALALANGAALAMVPFQESPLFTMGVQCPIVSLEFQEGCGGGKYKKAVVECSGLETNLILQPGECLSVEKFNEEAAVACQQECLVQ